MARGDRCTSATPATFRHLLKPPPQGLPAVVAFRGGWLAWTTPGLPGCERLDGPHSKIQHSNGNRDGCSFFPHVGKLMETVLMWSTQGSFLFVCSKQIVQILDTWQICSGGRGALEVNPLLSIFLQHPVISETILGNNKLRQPPKPQMSHFPPLFLNPTQPKTQKLWRTAEKLPSII